MAYGVRASGPVNVRVVSTVDLASRSASAGGTTAGGGVRTDARSPARVGRGSSDFT
ncbi:hypothetical protein [Actinosynnema sp. NPDC023587]|uniref:hypothetical protein n=1 Tax=Actinosynnema sp. NPDC023587 TaxID=3154695 RepID=UPI0033E03E8C